MKKIEVISAIDKVIAEIRITKDSKVDILQVYDAGGIHYLLELKFIIEKMKG